MKSLGKIIFFLLLMISVANAGVRATVDETNVELGDTLTYSLHLSGEDIEEPHIDTLCGEDVISTSSQTSIQMINATYSRTKTLSYQFIPQKSCRIEPVEVNIDGQVYKSNAVDITVSKVKNNVDADFIMELNTSKTEVFVGEPFEVTLTIKQRVDAQALDSKFEAPKFKGFWIKTNPNPIKEESDKYINTILKYTIAPQRVGELNVSKAILKIAKRDHRNDAWGSWIPNVKWKTYFSNDLSIDVKPLPNGVSLVGNFSISATVDKMVVNKNEALNLNIEVLGDGNLEDIQSFKPYIDGVNVFDEKIVINGKKLTQKLAFVGDKDFTIPPFELKFFNPKTKQVQTVSTKPIHIKVNHAQVADVPLTIKKQNISNDDAPKTIVKQTTSFSPLYSVVFYLFGLLSGVALMIYRPWDKIKSKEKKVSIKEPKKLLIKLLPFKDDEEVKNIVDALEQNIYHGTDNKVDKKALKEILKRYKID
jgi:hypothetical protein